MSVPPADALKPAYLIVDTESIPDGVLIGRVKYPDQNLSPEDAIAKAQEEARAAAFNGSDFLPVTFQVPVSICVAKVSADFHLLGLRCLDSPLFRTREMVRDFWQGWSHYRSKLVTFNGRGFDLPLLEIAAYRYGIAATNHFRRASASRHRFNDGHVDLMEFITNFGAIRMTGGLNLLSKLLGKPGKMEVSGSQVYGMYRQGQLQEINDYCSFDVLDTYFVFLRTRVLTGELALDQEQALVHEAKDWIAARSQEQPHLGRYLERWGDWNPWP
jgi:predicted PolB exonuclease-like 3'-5' exonuclease